jgi:PqqD family protein of HPr-rel-A system
MTRVHARVPRARDEIEVLVLDGEAVLYDSRRARLHRLNPTATALWQRCDGRRTTEAVVAELSARFGVSVETVAHDVARMLRQFEAAELVTAVGRDQVPGSDALGPPKSSRPSPPPTYRRME